jgi:hypothetical protein
MVNRESKANSKQQTVNSKQQAVNSNQKNPPANAGSADKRTPYGQATADLIARTTERPAW